MKNKLLLSLATLTIAGFSFFLIPDKHQNNETASYQPREKQDEKENPKASWRGASEYYHYIRKNQETGIVDPAYIMEARKQVEARAMLKSGSLDLNWEEIGPDNHGGRVRAILVDQNNSNRVYTGGISGGIYVSDNAAGSWRPVNDHMENLMVSTIAQAINGDIYVGTGTSFERGSSGTGSSAFIGSGMYKSTDGGNTFTLLDSTKPELTNKSGERWTEINKIVCDPTDANKVYAGTPHGFMYSADGGNSWKETVFRDCPDTSSSIPLQVRDLAITSAGELFIGGGAFSSILYSNNPSGGCASFQILKIKINGVNQTWARIVLAISPSDNNYIYALTEKGGNFSGLYKSTDKGQNWTRIIEPSGTQFGGFCNDQCDYDLALTVDPANKNKVFLGGVQIWSYDGNWTRAAGEFIFPPYYVHSDKHTFAWDPKDPKIMYVGTDGGIYKSMDRGQQFFAANRNLNIAQFYDVAFSATGEVLGGTQDNGTLYIDGKSGNTPMEATDPLGGDGFDCDISSITNAGFATIYGNDVYRAVHPEGPYANICERCSGTLCAPAPITDSYCSQKPFHTKIRLWESDNDLTSKDSLSFKADTMEQAVVVGNGFTRSFTGELTAPFKAAKLEIASVRFRAGNQHISNNDGTGIITGPNGTAEVNQDGTFTLQFDDPPLANQVIFAYFASRYPAGSTITLPSITEGLPVDYTLSATLNVGDKVKIQDPIQSILALGTSNYVSVLRGALDLQRSPTDVETGWIQLPNLPSAGAYNINAMEFSKDGNHLFVGSGNRLYRYSGLNELYSASDVDSVTVKNIYAGAQVVTGIAVDPNNADNVIITLGNYNNSNYVLRATDATTLESATPPGFVSIQGSGNNSLPKMPVYDALIDRNDYNKVILGTEFGVWASDNAFTSSSSQVKWSYENETIAHVPVFSVKQQTKAGTSNEGVVYLGTHGRGIWKTGSFVGIPKYEKETLHGSDFISDLLIYPNPMTAEGNIVFKSRKNNTGTVNIYNLQGKLVKSFDNRQFNEGDNRIILNTKDMESGTYIVTLRTPEDHKVNKFMILK